MSPMLSSVGILGIALLAVCGILVLVMREERKLRELVRKEREKNLVFALIFHQLDDMMTSVKWHSELMMSQEFGKLSLTQAELINKMNMSAADAVSLLKKYLAVSGKEFDLAKIRSEGLDFHDFLENLVTDLRSKKTASQS